MSKLKLIKVFLIISCAIGMNFFSIGFVQAEELRKLLEEAKDNNLQIMQAYHAWQSALKKVEVVGALDDPMVTYGYFGEEVQTRVGPQEQKFGIFQSLPFPGKRKVKKDIQRSHAAMLEEQYNEIILSVERRIREIYFDLFSMDQSIRIHEEEKALLEKLEDVAQRRYESNLAPQQVVIKIQVELSNLIKKIYLLKQQQRQYVLRLNQLTNRPSGQDFNGPLDLPQATDLEPVDNLIEKSKVRRGSLRAAEQFLQQKRHEMTLAKKDYFPDFKIGAEYIDIKGGTTSAADDGQDAWMTTFSVNVPIWFGKLKHQLKEKEEALIAAQLMKKNAESSLEQSIRDAYFQMNTYKNVIVLYETALIPQAQQAFESSQSAFETGA
ncbi:MAG: TolC family protein, partial [Candidatus Omnitrophica bacterium]|nr:TolC family protein [Candidatus Omnitrophota bacterium]